MGEPAELSLEQKAEALSFAYEIVEAVRNDDSFPILGLSDENQFKLLAMSQLLILALTDVALTGAALRGHSR